MYEYSDVFEGGTIKVFENSYNMEDVLVSVAVSANPDRNAVVFSLIILCITISESQK